MIMVSKFKLENPEYIRFSEEAVIGKRNLADLLGKEGYAKEVMRLVSCFLSGQILRLHKTDQMINRIKI